jgi:hypothetical protein
MPARDDLRHILLYHDLVNLGIKPARTLTLYQASLHLEELDRPLTRLLQVRPSQLPGPSMGCYKYLYLRAKQSGALHTSFGTYSEMRQQALCSNRRVEVVPHLFVRLR